MKQGVYNSFSLDDDSEFDADWALEQILMRPALLRLGNLSIKCIKEFYRDSSSLAALFYDLDSSKMYEVEIHSGEVDFAYITKAIEYWNLEENNHSGSNHCIVIAAKAINYTTLRLLHLFTSNIPVIVLQLKTYETENHRGIVFTKVFPYFI
ncbi:hypothetical protein J2755_000438 [Methanohalophilus levihalophilus]|uniref:hypothetical protein n=1 Tax=Methanohalophilus levihalophilus TaxID=1431282 RepID=UPI001AE19BE5|nr:hypothetical protein [Methanohalophilus levihalophilus]MBP2029518.1 hypothetical protein [Methanohalophilus levihalophilus]